MVPNRELVKNWFDEFDKRIMGLIEEEIDDASADINNEHLWETGYDGEEPNPHTQNIVNKELYRTVLNYMKNHVNAFQPFNSDN